MSTLRLPGRVCFRPRHFHATSNHPPYRTARLWVNHKGLVFDTLVKLKGPYRAIIRCFVDVNRHYTPLQIQQLLHIFPGQLVHHLLVIFQRGINDRLFLFLHRQHLLLNRATGD